MQMNLARVGVHVCFSGSNGFAAHVWSLGFIRYSSQSSFIMCNVFAATGICINERDFGERIVLTKIDACVLVLMFASFV